MLAVVVGLLALSVVLVVVVLVVVVRRLAAMTSPAPFPASRSLGEAPTSEQVAPAEPDRWMAQHEAALAADRSRADALIAERAQEAETALADRTARAEAAAAERIARDEAAAARRVAQVAQREAELTGRSRELEVRTQELALQSEALAAERIRLAGISPEQAKAEVLATVLAEAQRDAALQLRRVEADATAYADARAREIVAQAVQRIATPTTAEVSVATIRLPSEDFKGRIIGREGRNIRAFETVTGVDVIIDDTPELVQLSCFDPVRREVGRLTMASLVADGRIHPQRIEETYAASLAEVDGVCRRAAEDALLAVGINDLHEDLIGHLGALRFRTSYGQNVLAHLVESAAIAATMAAELGADVPLVTRCAFLHDIGKALTHEIPGSHALVGAALARRYGECEAVVHAIEAHHDEVAPRTIEAVLTQASDACSGGRPGARRESAAAYSDRLARIEAIASAQPGVERVFAVQAGHEVRVVVAPDAVDDLAAAQIARAVAKQIEQELTYPGQIRVTVIRESRVSEVAH